MFISKIVISNFRNFGKGVVEFTPGLNVIIGHNNAGKTNLIKALQLVFDRNLKSKPSIEDFSSDYTDFSKPPKIDVTVAISEHLDMPEDKIVIYDWLVKESPSYEAQLTYSFFLPNGKYLEDYESEITKFRDEDGKYKREDCLALIQKKYLKKYISRIYGGFPERQERAETDNLEKFDFQFLDAIRDAEKQMFFGNNTLLREVLSYFLDYDLTKGKDLTNLTPEENTELLKRENKFIRKSRLLLNRLINRIDKNKILEYSETTGAQKGGKPDFNAEVTEQDLLFALHLIIEKNGFKLPIKNNGLGYNNLLFIALILAKMQMERSNYMGDNAKIFPVLAIEEPEAHLHPSMQCKFLKFLSDNLDKDKQARQIFITTHSTHITSDVDINSIICLYEDYQGNQKVGYPGKVFTNSNEDQKSKRFVMRFLDATKSNMLFADRVIFVEGLVEQLLIPCLAAYIELDGNFRNKEEELLSKHVSIISVDGRTFKHFIKIFAFKDNNNNRYAINKKVACITDADPVKKVDNRWQACYPFELENNENNKSLSPHVIELKISIEKDAIANIKVFHPKEGIGKTLEYDLALHNPSNELLITDSFPSENSPNTRDKFLKLQKKYREASENYEAIMEEYEGEIIKDKIKKSEQNAGEKSKAFIAAVYYEIVKGLKGEHAFYLEKQLRENLIKKNNVRINLNIPKYINDAIYYITE